MPGTEVNLSTNTNNYQLKSRPDYLGSSKVSQVSSATPINKIDNTYVTQQPETLSNVPEYKKPGFFEQRRLDKNDKLNNDIKFNPNTYTQNSEFKSSNTGISTDEAVNMINNPQTEIIPTAKELKNKAVNESNRIQEQDYYNYDPLNDPYNNPPLAPVQRPTYSSAPSIQAKQIDLSTNNNSKFNFFKPKVTEETLPPYNQPSNLFDDYFNKLNKEKQTEDSYNLNRERNIRYKNYGEPEYSYGGPSNYDIQNALNVLKMAYGGYIPKADTGMGLNKNMDTSLYNAPKSSTYQDILKEKNKNKSNGIGNFVDNNWDPNNLAGQWASSLQTGKGYADTFKNTMDASTQFLNNMSMNDSENQLANQSSSNTPLNYNTDQGLYDQFGNQTFGSQGNQVLNQTNTGYNLNQPAIFKSGGDSFVLNGKKYEMGGEVELSDSELKALKKLGYIVTKKQ